MLLTIDFDEDFVDVESVTIASVFSLQAAGINGAKFDTPQTNCFATNCYTSFSEQMLNISMAQVESVVEPDVFLAN